MVLAQHRPADPKRGKQAVIVRAGGQQDEPRLQRRSVRQRNRLELRACRDLGGAPGDELRPGRHGPGRVDHVGVVKPVVQAMRLVDDLAVAGRCGVEHRGCLPDDAFQQTEAPQRVGLRADQLLGPEIGRVGRVPVHDHDVIPSPAEDRGRGGAT